MIVIFSPKKKKKKETQKVPCHHSETPRFQCKTKREPRCDVARTYKSQLFVPNDVVLSLTSLFSEAKKGKKTNPPKEEWYAQIIKTRFWLYFPLDFHLLRKSLLLLLLPFLVLSVELFPPLKFSFFFLKKRKSKWRRRFLHRWLSLWRRRRLQ